MNFSGACVGILFYGVSTQAFSIDRSCGGRNFGAILWSGGLLCGGIIAFALVRGFVGHFFFADFFANRSLDGECRHR